MNSIKFLIYLVFMAGVTYLIRMLPLVLIKKKIKNKYLLSFLHYIPYCVLSVMTVPAIFTSTGSMYSAVGATIIAVILAYKEKSLLTVAAASCVTVFIIEYIMKIM